PGIKGITDAIPGTAQWEAAREAVESFGAEFNALMSTGTDLQAIDITSHGELPYASIIERMDRAMISLWLGSDLSTLSKSNGVGASIQSDERMLLEQDDAVMISEILNRQVDRPVLSYYFGNSPVKAYVSLRSRTNRNILEDIEICERLISMGVRIPVNDLRQRFCVNCENSQGDNQRKGGIEKCKKGRNEKQSF
ncbi:MAG: DUF935 domain-containing protein, partial [Puniceicoccales bacterium]|nr:DUF935 domain-containing protein [Puniceicoccales bacterium]